LGLNPHAGDGGLLGKEEQDLIKPAVAKAFSTEKLVYGPYPADGFFGSGQYKQFDAVLAMYHDQGLIPFKTFAFYDGVNYTAGLPFVRTSPDHGTAYSLAGKGTAELISFRNAVYDAIHIVKNRMQHITDYQNPLPYSELKREKFRMDF
jgi:4-hydroxythreonine-4-phosphate dehydrogenase